MTPADAQPLMDGAASAHLAAQQPNCWTAERIEIRSWLDRNAPSLGELYAGAVTLLYETPMPGHVRFVAHAVREIRNRLPDCIAGRTENQGLQYKNRLDDIVALPAADALIADLGGPTAPTTTTVAIDRTFAKKVSALIEDHRATRAKPLDAARRLFEAIAPENTPLRDTLTPVLEQWITITEWFVGRAHDNGHSDGHYSADDLRRRFTIFERTLTALIKPFFATLEDLDAILQNANS
jgi:hypothetical protein